ncbi:hypothetical protein FHG87_000815 [Trinorchestia longiramus]|nr:hypothetical protein FHG87_000815 [Trinorchestia longiramus]
MNTHSRSVSAALDMVEAAISSLEKQARAAKLFEEQQLQQQQQDLQEIPVQSSSDKAANIAPNKDNLQLNGALTREPSVGRLTDTMATSLQPKAKFLSDVSGKNSDSAILEKNSFHEKSKESKKLRTSVPSVLLHQRSSTPRKKSRLRSSSSPSSKHHHRRRHRRRNSSHSKRERNNNEVGADSLAPADHKHSDVGHEKRSQKLLSNGYAQSTLSSKLREEFSDKHKRKEKEGFPFIPVGNEGKSFHVGVIIQKELGQLKSQPLGVWAASKQSAARKESEGSESTSKTSR